jgi:uncharacterized membrane protein YeaQ/YmgE (transglycosylase-associated protein family)
MSWIAYIVVGLIAGFLAKLAMPGTAEEPSGWIMTMILGIAGAVLGGWIWNLVLHAPGGTGINIGSIIVAFVGSCILIALLRLVSGRRAT